VSPDREERVAYVAGTIRGKKVEYPLRAI